MADVIEVTSAGGDRYDVVVRDHWIRLDQPVPDGGSDTGPTATEIFVAGLAACVAHYAGRFLRRHDVIGTALVRAEFEMGARPARVNAVRIEVEPPLTLPADLRDPFLAVVSRCTVHNSLTHPPEVKVTLV